MEAKHIHHTRGVYPNGDIVDNGVADFDLAGNIEYNRSMRPARAYFVDGKCVWPGHLPLEKIAEIEFFLTNNPVEVTSVTYPYR